MKQEKSKSPALARPNYYQGILQMRDVSQEAIDFVYNQLEKREDVAITKSTRYDNGIDLYLTSQQFIRAIGKKLKESFGGELKTTAKLHTRKKGKDLYRVNALFRPYKFKRGAILNIRGDEIKIRHIGQKIFGRDMKTGKKVSVRREDLPKY